MKKFMLLFLLGVVFTGISANAQNKKSTTIDLYYELAFKHDVTNSVSLDSIFNIQCIINKKDIKNFEEIKVKTGKSQKNLSITEYSIADFEESNEVELNLGKAGEFTSIIEVYLIDKDGKEKKLKNKKNKG